MQQPLIGTIDITGLRCPGAHGSSPEEQQHNRLFLVDVRVRTDLARPAGSDQLTDALDIAALADVVREVVAGPPRSLLERLAFDLARTVLERLPQVEQATIRVRKQAPPGLEADEEAVELSLSRG